MERFNPFATRIQILDSNHGSDKAWKPLPHTPFAITHTALEILMMGEGSIFLSG